MRLVHLTGPGQVSVNFQWLPTWLGMNRAHLERLELDLATKVAGVPATEENLDTLHEALLDLLVERFPSVEGLRDYLDGIKFIRL